MKKFALFHNNSGNRLDTSIGMGFIFALDDKEAQESAKKMFGETAWAEEVDIVPSPT